MACLFGHKWNGCKCERCGKVRNEQHDWDGCKCKKCDAVSDTGHKWNGCDCIICGKIRIVANRDEVKKITDRAALEGIINRPAHSYEVRRAAKDRLAELRAYDILKISDPPKIIAAIKEERDADIHRTIIEKLTDQNILSDIAGDTCIDGYSRIKAAEKLIDKSLSQNLLASIVKDSKDETYRSVAYDKITDKAVLQDISSEPFVVDLMKQRAHVDELKNIEKEHQMRIKNCKNHEWEGYNGGHYQGRVCTKCGASEIVQHYT